MWTSYPATITVAASSGWFVCQRICASTVETNGLLHILRLKVLQKVYKILPVVKSEALSKYNSYFQLQLLPVLLPMLLLVLLPAIPSTKSIIATVSRAPLPFALVRFSSSTSKLWSRPMQLPLYDLTVYIYITINM